MLLYSTMPLKRAVAIFQANTTTVANTAVLMSPMGNSHLECRKASVKLHHGSAQLNYSLRNEERNPILCDPAFAQLHSLFTAWSTGVVMGSYPGTRGRLVLN